jgi:hypothetical protein
MAAILAAECSGSPIDPKIDGPLLSTYKHRSTSTR